MRIIRLTLMLLITFLGSSVWAGETIRVVDPWVRAAPPSVHVLAAYMGIENKGSSAISLTGIQSPDFAKVELHETVMTDDMATMVPRDSLPIDAGGKLELKPGGNHIMLIEPKKPTTEGSTVPLTLVFSDGSRVDVQAAVRKGGEMSDHHGMH